MRAVLVSLIHGYQRWISPLFPPACRFDPTCSQYACEAVERHGVMRGLLRTACRILRCHPFHPGGYDPVEPDGSTAAVPTSISAEPAEARPPSPRLRNAAHRLRPTGRSTPARHSSRAS